MEREPRTVLRDLEAMARRGESLLAELTEARVEGSDDEGGVVAVADGLGRVIDLRISETATRYPQRLGALVTAAVKRARQAGVAAAEEHRATRFPGLPSLADVRGAMSPTPERADLQAVDYTGSAAVRNAIAEGMEVRREIERVHQEIGEHRIRQEIGVNAGTVVMNGTAGRVKIEIRPAAVHNVGAQRLAGQIVKAIRKAEARAEEHRMSAIDQVNLGGTAMGNLARDAQRVLGMDMAAGKEGRR